MAILNAQITNVSLSMADHGVLAYGLTVDISDGTGCCLGGYVLGKGYLGASEFKGWSKGTEALMRVMDTVGVERWEDLKGRYIRVKTEGWGQPITCFGNLMKEKWFDQKEFFSSGEND